MFTPVNSRSWWIEVVGTLLGFVYNLLYNRFSAFYDLTASLVSGGEWENWAASVLPGVPSGPCLEIGHGPGHLLTRLGNSAAAVGIDLSFPMNRRALRAAGVSKAVLGIVNADAAHLPFPTNYFSSVVATFPTPAVLAPASLRETHRVLRKGGNFLTLPGGIPRPRAPRDVLGHILLRLAGANESAMSSAINALIRSLELTGLKCETILHEHSNATLYILRAKKP